MPDDPDSDRLFAEVSKQLLGGVDQEAEQPRDDYFGLVADIVEDYRSFKPTAREIERSSLQKIAAAVCPNGQPAWFLGESELSWRQGLVSFCRPDAEDVFGEIASAHADSMMRIYGRWSDHELEMFHDPTLDPEQAQRRGAFLAPSLPIHKRELLSEASIGKILVPIHRAQMECRQILYRTIEDAHAGGRWLGFRPTGSGSYSLIRIGLGFDGGGDYSVDRYSYLKGFSYAEDEVDAGFWHRPPYPDQDHWLFLDTAQIDGSLRRVSLDESSSLSEDKTQDARRPGRPSGISYEHADAPYIELIKELVTGREGETVLGATRHVVGKHEANIAGNSRNAKIDRLRKRLNGWEG